MLRFSKALSYLLIAAYATCVAGLDFTGSNWIWTPNQAANGSIPLGNITLRRDFTPAILRVPVSANILIGADDKYTFYVNGLKVGTSSTFGVAQRYCVSLVKGCNVFAISAQNTAPREAGVVAAIQIRYSDGSTENVVSDGKWKAAPGTPAGFEQVAFDDSKWSAALVEGTYPGTSPPKQPAVQFPIPPEPQVADPPLQSANWIWTSETSGPTAWAAPIGARAFRKTIVLPNGQLAAQAKILIAVDDGYSLYVNGLFVGSAALSWTRAQRFVVNFPPTSKIVIALYAQNIGGPAAILASGQLLTCNCSSGSDTAFVTDGSWKYSTGTPAGFIAPGFIAPDFDDSAWPNAQVKGKAGIAPWGPTTVPAGNTLQLVPLPGAPIARPASVEV
ncbi:hypothetical protein FPV67DRAFT_626093 [Lyophyllum atratum]|nr:hypothetical protein FPV67DRAFT_626093 [Lyophyllum atratum]